MFFEENKKSGLNLLIEKKKKYQNKSHEVCIKHLKFIKPCANYYQTIIIIKIKSLNMSSHN